VRRMFDTDTVCTQQAALPHGGTIASYRLQVARWARLCGFLAADPMGARLTLYDARRMQQLLSSAAATASGTVALLQWLELEFGPGTAWRAAAILQDVALHDDTWDESLLDVPGLADAGDPPSWP